MRLLRRGAGTPANGGSRSAATSCSRGGEPASKWEVPPRRWTCRVAACRSVIARRVTEVDRAARRAGLMRAGGAATRYSDRDIILAVSLVTAHLGRVPSRVEYRAHPQTLAVRYSLADAYAVLRAAGVVTDDEPQT